MANGSPPFKPDHQFGRYHIFDLESSVLVRWMDKEQKAAISEMFLSRKEAWVLGALLQVTARRSDDGR